VYHSGMKHLLKLSALLLLSLALSALVATSQSAPTVSYTCGDQNASAQPTTGHCTEGMVTFRGSDLPQNVYVKVLSFPAGVLIDNGEYTAAEGSLTFTQTLVPAGGYTILMTNETADGAVLQNLTVYTDPLH